MRAFIFSPGQVTTGVPAHLSNEREKREQSASESKRREGGIGENGGLTEHHKWWCVHCKKEYQDRDP
jgi:hypothetical protein